MEKYRPKFDYGPRNPSVSPFSDKALDGTLRVSRLLKSKKRGVPQRQFNSFPFLHRGCRRTLMGLETL
ncbi:hypothetical protein V6Z11_D02G183400 [Gossypium hirsutum]